MGSLDQFVLGITFAGMSLALFMGNTYLAAGQAIGAAMYFLADPLAEIAAALFAPRD